MKLLARNLRDNGIYKNLDDRLGANETMRGDKMKAAISDAFGDSALDETYEFADGFECAYCGDDIPIEYEDMVPAADDDDLWAEIALQHKDDCEWVVTRAHRRNA